MRLLQIIFAISFLSNVVRSLPLPLAPIYGAKSPIVSPSLPNVAIESHQISRTSALPGPPVAAATVPDHAASSFRPSPSTFVQTQSSHIESTQIPHVSPSFEAESFDHHSLTEQQSAGVPHLKSTSVENGLGPSTLPPLGSPTPETTSTTAVEGITSTGASSLSTPFLTSTFQQPSTIIRDGTDTSSIVTASFAPHSATETVIPPDVTPAASQSTGSTYESTDNLAASTTTIHAPISAIAQPTDAEPTSTGSPADNSSSGGSSPSVTLGDAIGGAIELFGGGRPGVAPSACHHMIFGLCFG